jgi:UDPglucose 6-dehydrogenase
MGEAISVIGLGKLGFCMASLLASHGKKVIGLDINSGTLKKIRAGIPPIVEPKALEYLEEGRDNINTTSSYEEAILNSDLSIVIVPTPSLASGAFSLAYLKSALNNIGEALAKKDSFHLISVDSTVLPGSCRNELIPVLEKSSRKTCGIDFGFVYSPKFIAVGSVYRDLLNPDTILIGCDVPDHGNLLNEIYNGIVQNKPTTHIVDLENAELAKMAHNSFITMKITYANFLASICEKVPNGDVDQVTKIIGSDRRVGSLCLRGGLGFGGPCLPRDNRALSYVAKTCNVDATLLEAVDNFNNSIPARVTRIIEELPIDTKNIGVLGVAYKANTANFENSQALEICNLCSEDPNHNVIAYDEMISGDEIPLHHNIMYSESLEELIRKSTILVLSNPCTRDLLNLIQQESPTGTTIIDCWRDGDNIIERSDLKIVTLGKNTNNVGIS